jgi:aarF domain-containing kinase
MDYDVLLRTALCFYDRDDPDSLGGKNVQLFLEDMNAKDPVVEAAEPYILAGRMGMMLRGLAYSLGIAVSTAEMWRPEAEAFLRANGEQRP